ncbi:MAG: carbohydrate-binding family 9-like protein [Phycisphaeraceae bacterium]|nr:carbohydrate-binding family 9-like protein [Phycisphaeraceae bacterium]
MKTFKVMLLQVMTVVMLSSTFGCASKQAIKPHDNGYPVQAVYADQPVNVDGRLDDAVWAKAQTYQMKLGQDRVELDQTLIEGGKIRFAWDEKFLYMAVEFTDSDVVAEGTENGEHHYSKGDLAELFLWPLDQTWYWELYVTPNALQTSFFFPGPGRLLPSTFKNHVDLTVAAQVQGTFNDWSDRDKGWTAEMAVPVSALTARGEAWGPGAAWRVLVGRYNYSAFLPQTELSSMPKLSRTSFHLRPEYGRLILMPKSAK